MRDWTLDQGFVVWCGIRMGCRRIHFDKGKRDGFLFEITSYSFKENDTLHGAKPATRARKLAAPHVKNPKLALGAFPPQVRGACGSISR